MTRHDSMLSTSLRLAGFGLACLLSLASACSCAEGGILKSELVISTGLTLPIHGAAPAGDFDHLYIAEERFARLRRLDLTTHQLLTVLDLPDVVAGNQTGLNGFAFHPDFANNGKVYVNLSGDAAGNIRILEYTRSTVDPNVFDVSTEREILTISNPTFSHNAGWIDFSPQDGYLYIASGDGGNVPPEETKGLLAQDLNSIQGKMLRVDVDGDDFPADSTRNYSIPSNNPFASGGGAPEIFAYGLRHPFQNGFDRATGDLYIADVGSHVSEEIDFLPAGTNGGQNFGWRAREGLVDNPDYEDPTPPGAIDPIYAYSHGSFASVIGGYVYRGSSIPWLQGTYFFADYVRQELSSFRYDGQAASELTDRTLELAGELGSLAGVASYAEDAAGELYMLDLGRGDVYRISARTSTEAGDYNQDGVVNAADYSVWRNSLGSFVTAGTSADGNKNGQVDNGDYTIWKSFYGRTVGASGAASSTALAPEPASLVLFFVGAICLGSRRRLR